MSSRHGHKHKKKKTPKTPATGVVVDDVPCREHPKGGECADMKEIAHNVPAPQNWIARLTLFISVLVLVAYFVQACYMRRAMRVDQRAWVSIPFPSSFPLNGTTIPVITQIINSGKTPAKGLLVDVFASIFTKDDKPAVGDFSVGHPHERLHAPGVVFPRDPVPVNISVGTYLPEGGERATVPDDALRQDIANGTRYILFFGRATYSDVFGVEHYTQFCTGSGSGIPSDTLKSCLSYNDVDPNEE
jgi:hypothetical protein